MTESAPDRFPDIEIYIKRANLDEILAWLQATMGIANRQTEGQRTRLVMANGSPCLVVENAVKGGYASVWFASNQTPWATDRDCALSAWQHLQKEIRCSTGSWDGEDTGGWLRLTDKGEAVVNWLAT